MREARLAGTLHVCATPIGNLGDCSARLRDVLGSCALVLCEDTRRTRKLLAHLGVAARLATCHEHDEEGRVAEVLETLRAGADVAHVSDAGTPLLADPGYRLVRAVVAAGLPVTAVPGPSAVAAALSVAGLPTDAFCFEGFVPRKRAARRRWLAALAGEPRTLVLLETPHRLAETLDELVEAFGADRPAFLGREMTKLHEELVHGTLGAIGARFSGRDVKGEIVLVIAGAQEAPDPAREDAARRYEELVARGLSPRDAAREAGLARRDAYRLSRAASSEDE